MVKVVDPVAVYVWLPWTTVVAAGQTVVYAVTTVVTTVPLPAGGGETPVGVGVGTGLEIVQGQSVMVRVWLAVAV